LRLALPRRSVLSTPDGEILALREWPMSGPIGNGARGVVQLVHGLGEHAGRYQALAQRLQQWGFAVCAHDHHGHGESSGARGGLPQAQRLVDDLALVVDHTRQAYPGWPLVLLGHSLGGLVAASFVARRRRPVEALVLSSPGLDPGLSAFQRGLLAVLERVAPGLRVGNGLDNRFLSHDRAVVQAFHDDPLAHDRIGSRLAGFLAREGTVVRHAAAHWTMPTLLLYAGDDRFVRPAASAAFAAAAAAGGQIESHCFDGLYHELFNELEAEPVFAALRRWLDGRFPGPPAPG
jgi:alpha-beta hydrolase superfamily lysophospholipase